MLASASTQIPYLLIEAFLMTGLYSLFYVLAYSSIHWMWDISWTTALLAILAADFAYYWEHRIAHRVRLLWTQHAVHHRVHHGCDQKYLDKNYAGILIIWDRMFGSFQEEEETPN